MALVFADRVKETWTGTGTGTITLAGAATGYQSFAAVGNGNTCYYTIALGSEWEIGLGTYTSSGTTLARTTVLASSNSGSAVNFSAGTKDVWLDFPAAIVGGHEAQIRGSINGLVPEWTSTTTLGCSAGACFIESLGYSVYGDPADITPSSPANNTWYHIYAYSNSGVLTLESSTTAPVAFATPVGWARSKSGDTSRRYLYSARTNASGAFFRWTCELGPQGIFVMYSGNNPGAAPHRVLSNGTATTATTVDCSAVCPTTSRMYWARGANLATGPNSYFGNPGYTVSTTVFDWVLGANSIGNNTAYSFGSLDSSQNASYTNSAGSGSSYLDIHGYVFQR